MTHSTITPVQSDTLAKLAEIPPAGSEERERWLETAEQYGFQETDANDAGYTNGWLASEDAILALMSEARRQGQQDVLSACLTAPGSCLSAEPHSVSGHSACDPSRGVEDEKARVLEAELALDIAKIDLIMKTYMRDLSDDRLTIFDVASIKGLARQFAVPERAAYLRMKSLDMLSYQQDAAQGIEARSDETRSKTTEQAND